MPGGKKSTRRCASINDIDVGPLEGEFREPERKRRPRCRKPTCRRRSVILSAREGSHRWKLRYQTGLNDLSALVKSLSRDCGIGMTRQLVGRLPWIQASLSLRSFHTLQF